MIALVQIFPKKKWKHEIKASTSYITINTTQPYFLFIDDMYEFCLRINSN